MIKFGKALFSSVLLILIFSSSLSAQLARQWVARFNSGLKNSNSSATAIASDDSGNVYVTGWVTRKLSGVDIATIKYTSDGEFKWVQYYSGTGKAEDKASAIAVDTAHNVYITGSTSIGGKFDYVTIKYNSDGSGPAWVETYNGPGNGDDKAVAIAVNDSGNVYVTGWSQGAGSGSDYATLKYNALGTLQWARRYDGPASGTDSAFALWLRGFNDLFVTGTSRDTTLDCVTIRYGAGAGDTVWVSRFKGPGDDVGRALAVRNTGDVFVAGSSEGVGTGFDYLTIRLSQTDGTEVWHQTYDGAASSDDHAYAIALNGSSTVYVTGKSIGVGSFNDIVSLRYDQTAGGSLKVESYNGTANDDDYGVAVIGGGSPYILGATSSAGVGRDYALIHYKSNFTPNYDLLYNGPGNSEDLPSSMATFGSAVYVTGSSKATDKGSDFLTIKYVDPSNLKYRTFRQDSLTGVAPSLKLSSTVPNGANVRDAAIAQAYPKIKKGFPGYPGGLVLGNARPDSATLYGWIRIDKGSSAGKFLPHTGVPRGFDLIGGKPFVKEQKNPTVLKYNNHLVGELLALRINIGASDAEIMPPQFGDLIYDDGDTANPYVGLSLRQIAGIIDNNLTYWKKYPPVNWTMFDSMLTRTNRAFSGPQPIPWVSKIPLVVTGFAPVDSVPYLHTGIAPVLNPINIPPEAIEQTPVEYELYQNYPNPFNPTTTIEFNLPEQATVTLKIYDILGREVATLLDRETMEEGGHEVEFSANNLSSGVYFYRIFAGEGSFSQIKKMLLIK